MFVLVRGAIVIRGTDADVVQVAVAPMFIPPTTGCL
jgi:hypothetical protein